jgi:DNA-binding response OmpR family regulator
VKTLLVEDDLQLGRSLHQLLLRHNYANTWVRSAEDAKRFLSNEAFELLLFDIVLPGESGLALLSWYRGTPGDAQVIMLTARDSIGDRVNGLDAGADDYLSKPFALEELLSRMRALTRRTTSRKSALWRVGDIVVDTARYVVTVRDEPINLSKREYSVLLKLAMHSGKVLTREQLARGSQAEEHIDSNAVDVHICSLRKKLQTEAIVTVRGIGYVLEDAA